MKVLKKAATLSYHFQEVKTCVVVFFMSLQVFRQVIDAVREERYLRFRRTCIRCAMIVAVFGEKFLLYF